MMARLLLAFVIMLGAAAPAAAQFGFEGDTPILIDADKATYKGSETLLEGNVDVRQGEARIYSDKMDIFRESGAASPAEGQSLGVVTRIVATGNFRYVTPDNTVTGNRGVYERDRGIITVTGNVRLTQPSGSRVTGEKLVYNIKTKSAKFGDQCVGDGCDGRVSFSIEN